MWLPIERIFYPSMLRLMNYTTSIIEEREWFFCCWNKLIWKRMVTSILLALTGEKSMSNGLLYELSVSSKNETLFMLEIFNDYEQLSVVYHYRMTFLFLQFNDTYLDSRHCLKFGNFHHLFIDTSKLCFHSLQMSTLI